MASSSYYYNKYKQKKKEVSEYEDNIKDVKKILSNLTDSMSDEIRAINNELDALKSDLNKSVRHDGVFTANANAVTSEKEKTVSADPNLSTAIRELEEEISRLNRLKQQAAEDRDYYYRKYKAAKERERKEREEKDD